jgi:hypothetical protein
VVLSRDCEEEEQNASHQKEEVEQDVLGVDDEAAGGGGGEDAGDPPHRDQYGGPYAAVTEATTFSMAWRFAISARREELGAETVGIERMSRKQQQSTQIAFFGRGERKRRKCRPNVLLGLIRTTKSAYLDIGLERFRYDGLRNLKTSIGLTQ